MATHSPNELHPQLNLPRCCRGRRNAARVLADGAVGVEYVLLRQAEIRAVEQVEALEPELQLPLAGHRDVLADDEIDGFLIGPGNGVASQVADEPRSVGVVERRQ